MSPFEVRGQWTSLSSAPLPWSSLPDAEVPLVSCLLGCPGLSSAHGYPAKQIPVPISHETTKVGFNISHGTGGSISALRQENAWKVWGEPGVSPEGNRRARQQASTGKVPSAWIVSLFQSATPASLLPGDPAQPSHYQAQVFNPKNWSLAPASMALWSINGYWLSLSDVVVPWMLD